MMAVFKYFVHGLLFSAVYLGIAVSGLDFIFKIGITAILGFFIFGFINSLITRYLWKISMKSDYWSFLEQGFILIWPLAMINLLFILPLYPFLNNWLTIVVVSLVQCMPYGFVCKYIAGRYEEEEKEEETDVSKLDKYD
jgi:uncharacterized membrane protein